jgi:hypothetical protein
MKKMFVTIIMFFVIFGLMIGSAEAQKKGKQQTTSNSVCQGGGFIKTEEFPKHFENINREAGIIGFPSYTLMVWNNSKSDMYYKKLKNNLTDLVVYYVISIFVNDYIDSQMRCANPQERDQLQTMKMMNNVMWGDAHDMIKNWPAKDGMEQDVAQSKKCYFEYELPRARQLVRQSPSWPKCR